MGAYPWQATSGLLQRDMSAAPHSSHVIVTRHTWSHAQPVPDGPLLCIITRPAVVRRAVAYVACGHRHTVAVTQAGGVLAWGWNGHGQCGPERSEPHEPAVLQDLAGLRCIQAS